MTTKGELLEKYDGVNQGTKREIIKHLWRHPELEHEPEEIFRAIKDDCPAQEVSTVRNNLSALGNEDLIKQETRSFYQWNGPGRRRPNVRLNEVGYSFNRWRATLSISHKTLLFTFVIWLVGVLSGIVSLVALISPGNSIFGYGFIEWFKVAGTMTICGSLVVMLWVPLYVLDARLAE